MTELKKTTYRFPAAAAFVAALLALGGCSGTHIGDAWQCPMAQGKACVSVAGADPAVAQAAEAGDLAIRAPLYRTHGESRSSARAEMAEAAPACDPSCDPLAWFAGLFAAIGNPAPENAGQADSGGAAAMMSEADGGGTTIPFPASAVPDAGDLRTPEIIGRVWIAPFVDSDGVLREASWARVVIEPAGWRLK